MADVIDIFWFRRDLRLDDNHGLFRALESGRKVLPIFIFDSEILDKLQKNDARVTFIHDTLQRIDSELKNHHNSGIALFYGKPSAIFRDN